MAILNVQRLIEKAQSGEKLATADRRRAVAFLNATEPEHANTDLADLFHVSERTIRVDIRENRLALAREVKEDDVALVVGDIVQNFRRQLSDIEKSKSKSKLGHRDYLAHCVQSFELELKKVKALQELGFLPKNLGNMTVDKYEYHAIVDERTGAVDVQQGTPVEVDAEVVEMPLLTEGQDENGTPGEFSTTDEDAGEEVKTSDPSPAESAPEAV